MTTPANPIFDPDAFHQQYAAGAGGFDPDAFHEQYQNGQSSSDVAARHARSAQGKQINYGESGTSFEEQHPYLTGAAKGAAHSLTGIGELAGIEPSPVAMPTKPENRQEAIGYGLEQAGEGLALPGGPEAEGALGAAGRIGTSALGSGLLNKIQGGSFKAGALTGGGIGSAGEIARSVAPSIAESALGITRKQRSFGKTPGQAVLDETSGLRPGTIASQTDSKIGQLTQELESRAASSQTSASTKPALDVIDKEQIKAINQNNQTRYNMLHGLRQQLTTEFNTGNPIPQSVTASKVLDLKRGIGDLEKTWNPEVRSGIKPTVRKVYGALDDELDRAVPGADELNQKISSLIPASQRAKSTEQGAGVAQRVAHRMAAHTGALAGAGLGAGIGYERGGGEGAILGGLGGLVLPEALASPTVQMAGARTLASPVPARLARAAATKLLRLSDEDEPSDK